VVRYTFDGYGEHNDGSNFDGTGIVADRRSS